MDAWVNPKTGDYVPVPQGGLTLDPADGLANAVYVRLMTPLGTYWAAPDLGSRLHELRRSKAVARVEQMAQEYSRAALQPLIADGRAQSVDVLTELQAAQDGGKRLALLITVVDAAGRARAFEHFVKVA